MALQPIRLPRLQQGLSIVDPKTGRPSAAFVRYWNVELLGGLERSVNAVIEVQNEITEIQTIQTSEIARLNAVVFQGQTVAMQAQQAQAAANAAQQTADEALADGTVSGSATDPSVSVGLTTAWVPGPQVDLVGVVAGNLTITGTGPQQDADVAFVSGTTFSGEFRVVEIDGMTETVLDVFSMSAYSTGSNATVTNNSIAAVEAFNMPLTTTGSLSYRIDVRKTSGGELSDLLLYIFARRAA